MVSRKGEEEGWPAEGAKRKKGRVKTGQPLICIAMLLGELFFPSLNFPQLSFSGDVDKRQGLFLGLI